MEGAPTGGPSAGRDPSTRERGLSLVDAEEGPVWRLIDAVAETRWALDGLHLAANMQFLHVARFPGLGDPMPRTGNRVPGIADITSVSLRKIESFSIGTSFARLNGREDQCPWRFSKGFSSSVLCLVQPSATSLTAWLALRRAF